MFRAIMSFMKDPLKRLTKFDDTFSSPEELPLAPNVIPEPIQYEDSDIRKAVIDLDNRMEKKLRRASLETRIWNLIIVVIALASFVVALIACIK